MKKLLIGIIVLTLASCAKFNLGVEVKVNNNSDFTVTDITFSTSEKLENIEFESIEPNKSVKGFLSMKENKVDGHYIISFTRENGVIESEKLGYYSNGITFENLIEIDIENDSVIQKIEK